jgi:cation transport ATPase
LAQRSSRQKRKKRRAANQAAVSRGYARGREKNDAVRAELKPLRSGERPTAVTVGAIVALLLALANLVAALVHLSDGDSRKLASTLLPVPVLLLIAWGMWRARYWAVLGMQTVLALIIVVFAVSSIQAQNVRAVVITVVPIVLAGPLFWFLIKAMARIQMPTPPSARR